MAPNNAPMAMDAILNDQDFQMIEEQLRQLGAAKQLCERCKRCGYPVDGAMADIEALENHFNSVVKEFKGPQSPLPLLNP